MTRSFGPMKSKQSASESLWPSPSPETCSATRSVGCFVRKRTIPERNSRRRTFRNSMRNVLPLMFVLLLPLSAQERDSIDGLLDTLNRSLRGDAATLALLFTADSECRIGERTIATGPDSVAEALLPAPFSEQTRPRLENPDVFPISSDLTIVLARQVTYGTLLLKEIRPVQLLLRRTSSGWRIVSWSVPLPPLFRLLIPAPGRY